jgi:hypothetical protein
MTVILMTQEAGSCGEEIAAGIAERLGIELVHRRRLERCVAERMQIAEDTVRRVSRDEASLFERWMTGVRLLERRMAEEVVRLAAGGDVLIRAGRVIPLLRRIRHVVCVHICATERSSAAAALTKASMSDEAAVRTEIRAATRRWLRRRRCAHECENLQHYDLVLNTDRIPVAQCVEQVQWLAESPQFQPTPASRALLASLMQETRQYCSPREALASEPDLLARVVVIDSGRLKLRGVADNEQDIATIEDHLRGGKASTPSASWLPPAGLLG